MGACCSKQFADGGALEDGGDGACAGEGGVRIRLQGSCTVASMYTQQGRKGINQDAMTLWEVDRSAINRARSCFYFMMCSRMLVF